MTVADKIEITEVVHRYGVAVDSGDLQLLNQVFTPDAIWELKHQDGFVVEGIEAISDAMIGFHHKLDATQHLVGNAIIDVAADTARSRSDVRVALFSAAEPVGQRRFESAATYHDELQRTAEGWRISKRTIEVRWTDGNEKLGG